MVQWLLVKPEETTMNSPKAPEPQDMPRKRKTDVPSKSWADRAGRYKNIQISRDLADMLLEIGRDSSPPMSIADLVDSLIRPTVEAKQRALLERKLRELGGGKKAAG